MNIDNIEDFQEELDKKYNDSNIQTLIENIIKSENFIDYHISKKYVPSDGSNYVGEIFEIDITGKTREGHKEINIFAKKIVQYDSVKSLISIPEAFLKEMFIYNELSQTYNNLQDKYLVSQEKRLKLVNSHNCTPEVIMLENMSKKGFSTVHRMDIVSIDLAKWSIKELAKFHGLSITLQKIRPDYFNTKIKTIKPFLIEESVVFDKVIINIINYAKEYLECDQKRRIEENMMQLIDKYRNNILRSTSFCCLCHGDVKPNNILFKKNEGVISEVCLIDYQLIHYGAPVKDLIYYIFQATDQEFRGKHLYELKDYYFDCLNEFLKNFNLDIEQIYPKKSFEKDFADKLDYGLGVAFLMLPFTYANKDTMEDRKTGELKNLMFNWNSKFINRIRGAVDDFIQWGYL